MKVMLSSQNKSKKESLINGLKELNLEGIEVYPYKVETGVSGQPINEAIMQGCLNRNEELKKIAYEECINYDLLCSIEGGFEYDHNKIPYIVTYVVFEDKKGTITTGKSVGLKISEKMMKYVESGKSLNTLIEFIEESKDNKKNGGITGYLSACHFNRNVVDKEAVKASYIPLLYKKEREILDKAIDGNIRK
ncbi:MAG: DUF84 family protein [bacterium]